ncbi:MAG TPA: protein kinase [Gemmatimonadaceae bacterium]
MDLIEHLNSTLAGRYVIERELGRGGMATVYLARDLRHGRNVALKVLDPELGAVLGAERFLSEIRVTAGLQHPNLLPLFDSGEADGCLYYVMPYVEGETLRARLMREKQLPVSDAVHIAVAVANALDYAHRHGIIHRDLKPENILLHEGQPLVADFGIALAVRSAGGNRITQTGLSLGTPQYMSPEQATGDRVIDGRADVYALGAVLYELLTGDPPHTGSTAQTVIAKVLTERPRSVRALRESVPEQVDVAVLRALAKLPADRWRTPQEFGEALGQTNAESASASVVTPGAPIAVSVERSWRRLRAVAAASVLATCVLAGVAVWEARALVRPRDDQAVRFSLDSLRLPDVPRGIAVSPDGRLIAYIGIVGPGRSILVRALNDLRPRAIANGGFSQLFFSADGKSIGLITGSLIQRIAVTGGALVEVARLASPVYGAVWTPSGQIIMGTARGLVAVPASGGAPRVVTRPDSARGEASQRWPVLLPDGQSIAYESVGRTGPVEGARIGIASLATGTSTITNIASVCPLGVIEKQLVFATKDGLLMTGPLDARKGQITRNPVPVLDSLAVNPDGCVEAAISADGSLAYQHGLALSQVVSVDLRGSTQPLLATPRAYGNPRYSPDGRRVAVSIRAPAGTDLWILDVAAASLTRFTSDGASNSMPEWAPDGTRLLWVSNRGGSRSLWWQPADGRGSAELLLRLADREVTSGVLTRDARHMVYGASDPSNPDFGGDVWIRGLASACVVSRGCDTVSRVVAGSRFFEGSPRPSPDGRWVAYTSLESGDMQVYVSAFPDFKAHFQVSTRRSMAPMWSPDSKTLYFITADSDVRELTAAKLRTTSGFTVESRTALMRGPLSVAPSSASYDVSPDGTHLIVVQLVGMDDIVIVHHWRAELLARLRDAGQ